MPDKIKVGGIIGSGAAAGVGIGAGAGVCCAAGGFGVFSVCAGRGFFGAGVFIVVFRQTGFVIGAGSFFCLRT
ncbi:MAG: hypothetical protein MUF05_02140 [Candidatus Omnitrophica bacterium]|nr:hypothetical protein [Candidatus Omnitrophota bacterium]